MCFTSFQSISFHENGKRHKENVQNHISKLSKKSAKDYKQKEKMDDEIKKMEAAAMASYLKDVQNNADMTSQVLLFLFYLEKKNIRFIDLMQVYHYLILYYYDIKLCKN